MSEVPLMAHATTDRTFCLVGAVHRCFTRVNVNRSVYETYIK